MLKARSIYKRVKGNELLFAILISLAFVLPIAAYTASKHAAIAPLNLLSTCCGWKNTPTGDKINSVPSDVTDFVLPNRFYTKKAISKGQIPLWNPSYFGGEAFYADVQSTVLHPVNLFYLVTDELNVQTISVIMSLLLMCMCTILMLRQLGRSHIGSAVGGLAFSGSCFAIFWAPFGMMTWMMAAMPLSILLFLKWQATKNNSYLGWLALCLGLQTYCGHIQFSFLVYINLMLFAMYYFLFSLKPVGAHKKVYILFFITLLSSVLISSAQLLPFIEQANIGHRAGASLSTGPVTWGVVGQDIKNFFSTYNFGSAGSQTFNIEYGPFRYSLGLLPALFMLIAIIKALSSPKNSRIELYFAFLFVFATLWMWGSLPQQVLAYISASFKSINPRYFMALGLFAVACLSAFGFDHLYKWANAFSVTIKPKQRLILLGLLAISVSLVFLYPILVVFKHYSTGFEVLYVVTALAVLALSLIGTLLAISYRVKIVLNAIPLLYILFSAFILFYLTVPIIPKSVYKAGNPYFEYIIRDSHIKNPANTRIVSAFNPQTNLYYGLSVLNGYSALYSKSTEILIHAINFPAPTVELSAGPNGSHNYILVNNISKPTLLKNLGVEYIIASNEQVIEGYHKVYPSVQMPYAVFKSERPAPQIYFASSTININVQEQLETIKQNSLAYHQVGIERNSKDTTPEFLGSTTYDLDINKINITTRANQSQYLFIGQTYRPQWKARIDGRTTPIYKANYNFMAIDVPSGDHHIDLIYTPITFTYGAILSLAAVGLTVSFIAYCKYPKQRRKALKS
jgi:hypothetical protein